MSNLDPIGVFDSGVGGLSVLRWIRDELPNEDLLYIADSAYAPYGNRGTAFIEQRSIFLTRFLIQNGAKAVVVACNTATAASISILRSMFDLPIIGMEPGVKPALSATRTKKIGILATTETLRSTKFNQLIKRFCDNHDIVVHDCPGLVEQVEKADFRGIKTRELIENYMTVFLSKGVDTIVLGCTHYIFLKPLIRDVAGEDINIIDTGSAVAREVGRRLRDSGLQNPENRTGSEVFYVTNNKKETDKLIKRLWNRQADIRSLPEDSEMENNEIFPLANP